MSIETLWNAICGNDGSSQHERDAMRSEYITHQPPSSAIQMRQEWFREYHAIGNARETCMRFGISRKTFYKWLKRYKDSGGDPTSLADLPRTPHHSPRRTSDEVRALVLQLRNATGFGPRRLSRELSQQKGVRLSERTIWKIIRANAPLAATPTAFHPDTLVESMRQVSVGV